MKDNRKRKLGKEENEKDNADIVEVKKAKTEEEEGFPLRTAWISTFKMPEQDFEEELERMIVSLSSRDYSYFKYDPPKLKRTKIGKKFRSEEQRKQQLMKAIDDESEESNKEDPCLPPCAITLCLFCLAVGEVEEQRFKSNDKTEITITEISTKACVALKVLCKQPVKANRIIWVKPIPNIMYGLVVCRLVSLLPIDWEESPLSLLSKKRAHLVLTMLTLPRLDVKMPVKELIELKERAFKLIGLYRRSSLLGEVGVVVLFYLMDRYWDELGFSAPADCAAMLHHLYPLHSYISRRAFISIMTPEKAAIVALDEPIMSAKFYIHLRLFKCEQFVFGEGVAHRLWSRLEQATNPLLVFALFAVLGKSLSRTLDKWRCEEILARQDKSYHIGGGMRLVDICMAVITKHKLDISTLPVDMQEAVEDYLLYITCKPWMAKLFSFEGVNIRLAISLLFQQENQTWQDKLFILYLLSTDGVSGLTEYIIPYLADCDVRVVRETIKLLKTAGNELTLSAMACVTETLVNQLKIKRDEGLLDFSVHICSKWNYAKLEPLWEVIFPMLLEDIGPHEQDVLGKVEPAIRSLYLLYSRLYQVPKEPWQKRVFDACYLLFDSHTEHMLDHARMLDSFLWLLLEILTPDLPEPDNPLPAHAFVQRLLSKMNLGVARQLCLFLLTNWRKTFEPIINPLVQSLLFLRWKTVSSSDWDFVDMIFLGEIAEKYRLEEDIAEKLMLMARGTERGLAQVAKLHQDILDKNFPILTHPPSPGYIPGCPSRSPPSLTSSPASPSYSPPSLVPFLITNL